MNESTGGRVRPCFFSLTFFWQQADPFPRVLGRLLGPALCDIPRPTAISFFTSVLGSGLSIENCNVPFGGHIAGGAIRKLREDGTTVRQVTQVVF